MKQNITVLVPSFIKTSIHDYSLVDFIKYGLKRESCEVRIFNNEFGYASVEQFSEGLSIYLSALKKNYQQINLVLFGCSCNTIVGDNVDKLVFISPNFEPKDEIKAIIKNGVHLDEIGGIDYEGYYYNKLFLASLCNEYNGDYLNNLDCNKIMINGLLNENLSQVESAVFCRENNIEYLGLEDMDFYINDFYNREFILEELMNIN